MLVLVLEERDMLAMVLEECDMLVLVLEECDMLGMVLEECDMLDMVLAPQLVIEKVSESGYRLVVMKMVELEESQLQ